MKKAETTTTGEELAEAAQEYLNVTVYDDIDRSTEPAEGVTIVIDYEISIIQFEGMIERFSLIAGKAGANYGKATEPRVRQAWLQMTSTLHAVIDDMNNLLDKGITGINYNLGEMNEPARQFLGSEFKKAAHAMAGPTYQNDWKNWSKAAKQLKTNSGPWMDMANQVLGFEQLNLFS